MMNEQKPVLQHYLAKNAGFQQGISCPIGIDVRLFDNSHQKAQTEILLNFIRTNRSPVPAARVRRQVVSCFSHLFRIAIHLISDVIDDVGEEQFVEAEGVQAISIHLKIE